MVLGDQADDQADLLKFEDAGRWGIAFMVLSDFARNSWLGLSH